VPVFFPVRCQLADSSEMWGRAFNLSSGGIALGTNHPISTKEQLKLEFLQLVTFSPIRVMGKVVWSKFHCDAPKPPETMFTLGVEFLDFEERSQTLLSNYIDSSRTLLLV